MPGFQFPIFVRSKDSGDVRRHTSVANLQRELERIDVEYEEYEAWDAIATPIRLSVLKSVDWLQLEPTGAPQPKQLVDAIQQFARREAVETDPAVLNRGDYSGALEQVAAAIRTKHSNQGWW